MGILLSIIGIALIIMSLLLLLASPVGGILGLFAGVAAFIYGRKYTKQKKIKKEQVEENARQYAEEISKTSMFSVAGFNYRQDELKSLLVTPNDDYELTGISFIDEVGEKTYEFFPEWYKADLVDEPENEHDPNAIAVYVQDVKIGYIAKKDQEQVKGIDAEEIEVEIFGGQFKDIRCDEYGENWKVVEGETPYKATLYIKSK